MSVEYAQMRFVTIGDEWLFDLDGVDAIYEYSPTSYRVIMRNISQDNHPILVPTFVGRRLIAAFQAWVLYLNKED